MFSIRDIKNTFIVVSHLEQVRPFISLEKYNLIKGATDRFLVVTNLVSILSLLILPFYQLSSFRTIMGRVVLLSLNLISLYEFIEVTRPLHELIHRVQLTFQIRYTMA